MHRTSSASTFEVLTWRFFSHITQEICQNSPLWIFLKKLKKKLGVDERFTIFRSEEHTSELQPHVNLVCRLLPENNKLLVAQHSTPPIANTAPHPSHHWIPL